MSKLPTVLDSFRDRYQKLTADQQVSVRISDSVLRRVDEVALRLEWSRAQTIKALLEEGLRVLE